MYPAIILTIAVVVTVFMIWKVVPVFANMYGGMGVELPGPTRFLIAANGFITGSGGIITLAVVILIFGAHTYFIKTNKGYKSLMDKVSIKLPLQCQVAWGRAMKASSPISSHLDTFARIPPSSARFLLPKSTRCKFWPCLYLMTVPGIPRHPKTPLSSTLNRSAAETRLLSIYLN